MCRCLGCNDVMIVIETGDEHMTFHGSVSVMKDAAGGHSCSKLFKVNAQS